MLGATPDDAEARSGLGAGVVRVPFEEFYRREYAAVVRLTFVLSGRSEVAEDVAQEAFLSAQRRWDRIAAYDDPGGWVRRVATNRCRSGFRRASAEVRALARLRGRPPEAVVLPEPAAELWQAVRSLPRRQAQVLALTYVEDRTAADVAALLGCGEETVRTHLRRGRDALARKLAAAEEEAD